MNTRGRRGSEQKGERSVEGSGGLDEGILKVFKNQLGVRCRASLLHQALEAYK